MQEESRPLRQEPGSCQGHVFRLRLLSLRPSIPTPKRLPGLGPGCGPGDPPRTTGRVKGPDLRLRFSFHLYLQRALLGEAAGSRFPTNEVQLFKAPSDGSPPSVSQDALLSLSPEASSQLCAGILTFCEAFTGWGWSTHRVPPRAGVRWEEERLAHKTNRQRRRSGPPALRQRCAGETGKATERQGRSTEVRKPLGSALEPKFCPREPVKPRTPCPSVHLGVFIRRKR